MFYFRLNKVRILDNREKGSLFGVFRKDLAEVSFISLVTTGNDTYHDLDALLQTTNEAEQDLRLQQIVTQVASSRILSPVYHVKDGQTCYFGDTGYVVFQQDKLPKDFNWVFMAMELDRDQRDLAQEVSQIVRHPEYKGFKNALFSGLKMAGVANPTLMVGYEVSKFIAGVWLTQKGKNKDDQIGLLYTSFSRAEHYPNGHRDKQDVPDLTNNMFVDYTIFGVDEKPKRKPRAPKPPEN